ncbi:MAG: DUF5606 domain-containing protein [Chitinophagales bacterium]|nr:DUF5606 domain-containing protein [Chitinophagales bacterium]
MEQMTLSQIVVVTGMPGLYKIEGKRNDGLVITSLSDNKTTFASGRKHLFTTLDNITIYTTGEGISLKKVLSEMKSQEESNPPVYSNDEELKKYIEKIIPDYDREKLYVSDMKKLVKWYEILKSKNLLDTLLQDEQNKNNKDDDNVQHATESQEKESKKVSKVKNDAGTQEGVAVTTSAKSHQKAKNPAKTSAPAKKINAPRKAQ